MGFSEAPGANALMTWDEYQAFRLNHLFRTRWYTHLHYEGVDSDGYVVLTPCNCGL